MKFTKEKILDGIMKFVLEDVLPSISDTNFKVIVGAAMLVLRNQNGGMEKLIFGNPAVEMLLMPDGDGNYNPTSLLASLETSIQNYGKLTVTIPPIPLISKDSKELIFGAEDVDKLWQHIGRTE